MAEHEQKKGAIRLKEEDRVRATRLREEITSRMVELSLIAARTFGSEPTGHFHLKSDQTLEFIKVVQLDGKAIACPCMKILREFLGYASPGTNGLHQKQSAPIKARTASWPRYSRWRASPNLTSTAWSQKSPARQVRNVEPVGLGPGLTSMFECWQEPRLPVRRSALSLVHDLILGRAPHERLAGNPGGVDLLAGDLEAAGIRPDGVCDPGRDGESTP
jgi:hypothetical protein